MVILKRTGITFALLLIFMLSCNGNDGKSISVDGRKITTDDVRQEMPEAYKQLRSQYEEGLFSMKQELANRKLFELEAESQDLSLDEYMESIQRNVSSPSEEDMRQFHSELVERGEVSGTGNEAYENIRPQLAAYLRQDMERTVFQEEIQRLREKYNYRVIQPRNISREDVEIGDAPIRGNPDAPVTVIEFSDFECPFCQRVQPTVHELQAQYGDKIRWVFKDFPLDFHENAINAHIAHRCMHQVAPDTAWDFFDEVFAENRPANTLQPDALRERAASHGADLAQYDTCVEDPASAAAVEANIEQGNAHGVRGTPAFFINGRFLSGAQPKNAFVEIIEEEL